ncbi:MAG: GrpB family protein [Candidatus Thermoplasmatota archaeon]|nr:GrpB family protein [Candidatus Thermoplasmatota archaeon]MBU4071068.1 GrpB family protein [Candidatus Thermoplasmatota archaeon]MBU4145193.1 GrpB family protein [Candidatus Thermoplasmatota archaeon]MBU4591144.1 GrpB family protein [Candidatus Thermoplasmatota archaeon]
MPNVPNRAELGRLYPIHLVDYDPSWPPLFQREKKRLLSILGNATILRIEHFGSTAIPGIRAKPTIDILIELVAGASVDEIHEKMVGSGYIRMVEQEDHVMFVRGYSPQGLEKESFHIHMYPEGHGKISDSILFRDYLREHPEAAREYQVLKEELALKYRNDREAYTEGKGEFVKNILKHVRY